MPAQIDPQMPHIEMKRGGKTGIVINMFDVSGKKTFDAKKGVLAVVHFEDETDPQKRQILVQLVPDYVPYFKGTVH